MAVKVRTWVWIAVGVAAVMVLGLVAIAGVGFYFVSQHIQTAEVTPASAADEFQTIRTGFPGQRPLIEIDGSGRFRRAADIAGARPAKDQPERLYLLAFDPADGRLVRFNIPFWLLRIKTANATIDLNGNRMDLEDLRLSVQDLERLGPALIVDHVGPEGERVLVWSR